MHQTHSHLHPHLSLIHHLSSSVPAEGHNMAGSFGEALKVPMLHAAWVNMAQQFIKTHILCLHLFEWTYVYWEDFLSWGSWLQGHIPLARLAERLMPYLLSLLLYLRGHLDRSDLLMLNNISPVEYDEGRAKEGYFEMWEKETGRGGGGGVEQDSTTGFS